MRNFVRSIGYLSVCETVFLPFPFSVFHFLVESKSGKRKPGKGFGAELSFLRKSSSTFYFEGRIEFFFSDSLNHDVIICRSQNI